MNIHSPFLFSVLLLAVVSAFALSSPAGAAEPLRATIELNAAPLASALTPNGRANVEANRRLAYTIRSLLFSKALGENKKARA